MEAWITILGRYINDWSVGGCCTAPSTFVWGQEHRTRDTLATESREGQMDRNESRQRQDSILRKQIDYTLKNYWARFYLLFHAFIYPKPTATAITTNHPLQYHDERTTLSHSVTPMISWHFYSTLTPILHLFLFVNDSFVRRINPAFTYKHQSITDMPVIFRQTKLNNEKRMKTVKTNGPMNDE
jgi:hypothetical protein